MSASPPAHVEDVLALLASVPVAATDGERVRQVEVLERLKAAASSLQIRASASFAASQRATLTAAGVPTEQAGRSIGSQLALARRDSPAKGSRFLGLAEALVDDMPRTLAALERGETSEWRATLAVRETAILSREHRRAVDAELGSQLSALGDAQTAQAARRIGMRLDTDAARRRAERAALDRRVTIRPAPDAMAILSAVLPSLTASPPTPPCVARPIPLPLSTAGDEGKSWLTRSSTASSAATGLPARPRRIARVIFRFSWS